MEDKGWIKLHRKVEDWEWYTDPVASRLFFHLLIKVNIRDVEWQGITVRRGQVVTSLRRLADALLLTKKQIRLGLWKLQKTNEIMVFGANRFSLITICKFDSYQGLFDIGGHTEDTQMAHGGHTEGAQMAHGGRADGAQRATTKEIKNKEIKNNNISTTPARACTCVSVEELAAWLKYKSGGIWKETAMMQLGVKSRGALELMFEDFQRECIAQGVTEKEERDIQPHFMAQMRIRQRKEKENAKIERNNGRDNRPTKSERDEEVAEYVIRALGYGS